MRTGTSHFVSRRAACDYYAAQGLSEADVRAKIAAREIYLGKPKAGPGEVVSVIPGEGRYQVESPEPVSHEHGNIDNYPWCES